MKNMLSIMLLAIMVCCWSCSGGEDVPAPTPTPNPTPENNQTNTSDSDREALIDFYKATNGDNWKNNENWCSDKPLKEWYGIKTSILDSFRLLIFVTINYRVLFLNP